jgi:hypothetical protein
MAGISAAIRQLVRHELEIRAVAAYAMVPDKDDTTETARNGTERDETMSRNDGPQA